MSFHLIPLNNDLAFQYGRLNCPFATGYCLEEEVQSLSLSGRGAQHW